jgi:hypothetical protein
MKNTKTNAIPYEVVVMTTAVDRPDLHMSVFTKYKNYLKGANIKWVITINNIVGKENETELQLKELLNDFDIHIKTFPTGGTVKDFFNSAKYCINFAKEINPSKGYLWLEDDWNYQGNITLFDILQSNEFGPMDYIQLVERNHEVSFNPGLWGVDLFNKLCIPILEKPFCPHTCNNPERACVYPIDIVHNMVNKFIHNGMFTDAGRDWAAKKDMWRTFQKNIKQ